MDVPCVHAPRRELPDLQERRARVEQAPHPLARQQLAALEVLFTRLGVSAERDQRDLLFEVVDHGAHPLGIAFEFRRPWVDVAFERAHANPKSGTDHVFWRSAVLGKTWSVPVFTSSLAGFDRSRGAGPESRRHSRTRRGSGSRRSRRARPSRKRRAWPSTLP